MSIKYNCGKGEIKHLTYQNGSYANIIKLSSFCYNIINIMLAVNFNISNLENRRTRCGLKMNVLVYSLSIFVHLHSVILVKLT